jgi:hypothetical protein
MKCALQMKGRWKSYINVWFPFMYFQKWNCYFQNRIIMFYLPVPTLIYLWEIYILPGSICLFCSREECGPILGIYKSLTDTWMWKLGLRPRNSQKGIHKWDFHCSVCMPRNIAGALKLLVSGYRSSCPVGSRILLQRFQGCQT